MWEFALCMVVRIQARPAVYNSLHLLFFLLPS
jgi:hypothetical protein